MNWYDEFNVYVGNELYDLELVGKVKDILTYLYDQIKYIEEDEWQQDWLEEVNSLKSEIKKANWSMDRIIFVHDMLMGGFVAHSELPQDKDFSNLMG